MIVWTLLWFWFKIEFVVDLDTRKDFLVALTPNINLSWTTKDKTGFRNYQFGINFLNTSFNINFYFPSCYFFNKEGQFIGKRIFPMVEVEEFHFERFDDENKDENGLSPTEISSTNNTGHI